MVHRVIRMLIKAFRLNLKKFPDPPKQGAKSGSKPGEWSHRRRAPCQARSAREHTRKKLSGAKRLRTRKKLSDAKRLRTRKKLSGKNA